ncbi:winged helix-turn-helix domain-containing protein [Spongiimicrobium salis]|uniref:winged helix-turn-helix domain-containing protein n=1 Tax=Spongiimicrobium salis TaxID=1667022 RepID=UPI00374D175E
MMHRINWYIIGSLILCIGVAWGCADSRERDSEFPGRVKVALRDVGNKLLLGNKDSTSLIPPITFLEDNKYELSFHRDLSILPDSLVNIVRQSFQKANLPEYYRIEVLQCVDNEVAYSYEMNASIEHTIIPCANRLLPMYCYRIHVVFTQHTPASSNNPIALYLLLGISILGLIGLMLYQRKKSKELKHERERYTSIGRFQFYPEQNKLVREAVEINLSRKECELLAIFVAHPNTVIKRDELTKKVWEDNGVIVGRSLDTYISKLRKKLQEDKAIKLVNVHGVGYKLVVLGQN